MAQSRSAGPHARPGLSFCLLGALLAVLWLAGGASRGDVSGQVVVRGVTWGLLVIALLFAPRPAPGTARPVLFILLAALALALIQLVPLPPALWQALPGRALIARAAALSGEPQPWRPWSMVPGATVNAASSLVVPLATLLLAAGLRPAERAWLPGLVLGLVAAAMLAGLLQFSGSALNNPLINDSTGAVSGTFANRNHFALFMAMGCVLAPAWAFREGRQPPWRGALALGLVLLFALTILASGSRAGLALGALGIALGLAIVWQGIRRALGRYPRWVFPALVAALVALVAGFVLVSIAADRAVAINRAFAIDPGQDMRSRGLPTVLAMIGRYFPAGSGLGGFDPLFRIDEPFALLKPTYFNHAHNDVLEIALDAGLPGLLLLAAALAWWAWASVRHALPKLGSALLLLVIVASLFDYPARTPMMMAMMVLAGVWLGAAIPAPVPARAGAALPTNDQHL